jgi:hypothetical protein
MHSLEVLQLWTAAGSLPDFLPASSATASVERLTRHLPEGMRLLRDPHRQPDCKQLARGYAQQQLAEVGPVSLTAAATPPEGMVALDTLVIKLHCYELAEDLLPASNAAVAGRCGSSLTRLRRMVIWTL